MEFHMMALIAAINFMKKKTEQYQMSWKHRHLKISVYFLYSAKLSVLPHHYKAISIV